MKHDFVEGFLDAVELMAKLAVFVLLMFGPFTITAITECGYWLIAYLLTLPSMVGFVYMWGD